MKLIEDGVKFHHGERVQGGGQSAMLLSGSGLKLMAFQQTRNALKSGNFFHLNMKLELTISVCENVR
jgi:hypothetical protein